MQSCDSASASYFSPRSRPSTLPSPACVIARFHAHSRSHDHTARSLYPGIESFEYPDSNSKVRYIGAVRLVLNQSVWGRMLE
jgi:hypothetical protein